MRFVPVLDEFITWRGFPAGRHFQRIRGFIADANSAIRHRSGVTLPPHFTRREPVVRRRSGAVGRERKNKG
jgi:hypothetical protein